MQGCNPLPGLQSIKGFERVAKLAYWRGSAEEERKRREKEVFISKNALL